MAYYQSNEPYQRVSPPGYADHAYMYNEESSKTGRLATGAMLGGVGGLGVGTAGMLKGRSGYKNIEKNIGKKVEEATSELGKIDANYNNARRKGVSDSQLAEFAREQDVVKKKYSKYLAPDAIENAKKKNFYGKHMKGGKRKALVGLGAAATGAILGGAILGSTTKDVY